MLGFYDGLSYRQFNSMGEFLDHVLIREFRGYRIYAHNGGKFDFLFMFDEIQKRNFKASLCIISGRVASIKIKLKSRHSIEFCDSFCLLPFSLQKLSDAFKPAHPKIKDAINFETERMDRNNAKHREYLEHDCKCLYEVMVKFFEMPFIEEHRTRLTLASTALHVWRGTLKASIRVTPQQVQDFCRDSVAGGRCEIFRPSMDGGALYDVNSLYPAMMLKPLPCEVLWRAKSIEQFGFHAVEVFVPNTYMPILHQKIGGKLIFPTGHIKGVFFSEELKLAVEQGAQILKYNGGYEFTKRTDLFSEYVDTLYKLRLANHDNAINLVAKLLMNSCYGKTGEREEKKSFQRVDPKNSETWPKQAFSPFRNEAFFEKTGYIEVKTVKRTSHMLCHIASAITAWGRIHMARSLYIPHQGKIHYTDTDSGFIAGELDTSNKLGELKKEYEIKKAYFLLPKGYWVEGLDGAIIRKLKGFPKETLKTLNLENFKKGKLSFNSEKVLTFKESLIRTGIALNLGIKKKTLNAEYNKRRLLPTGETEPWVLDKEGNYLNG